MAAARYAPGSRKGAGGRPRGPATEVVRLPLPIAKLARRLAEGTLRAGDIAGFLDVEAHSSVTVPLAGSTAACGFPSPADDYLDRPLDFNELLIQNPAATFAVRLASDSMTGAGLLPGDIAIVDRSLAASNGNIVLALIDGEFTVKRFYQKGERVTLKAENAAFPDIKVGDGQAFEIWGVVTGIARRF